MHRVVEAPSGLPYVQTRRNIDAVVEVPERKAHFSGQHFAYIFPGRAEDSRLPERLSAYQEGLSSKWV